MATTDKPFEHPLIVCEHDLDTSDIEILGYLLAAKLKRNIEVCYGKNSILKDKMINYENSNRELILRESNSLIIPEMKYILKFDDVSFFIYDGFFEIKFDFELDYHYLKILKDENQLLNTNYLMCFFEDLKSLQIKELHFSIFKEFKKERNEEFCWEVVSRAIKASEYNFMLPL